MKTSMISDPRAAGATLLMLLLSLVLFAAPAFGATPDAEAVKKACESLIGEDFKKYNDHPEFVRKIQRGLVEIFGDSVGSKGDDGNIGSDTTEALKQFCVQSIHRPIKEIKEIERNDGKEKLADIVVATVLQYSAIADEFPDAWNWIASVAGTQDGQVAEVFRVEEQPLEPERWINEGFEVSYQLVESDLAALAALATSSLGHNTVPEIVLWALKKGFKDVEYPASTLFVRALQAKLYPIFETAIVDSAEGKKPLRLTVNSFEDLKDQKIPAVTLKALRELKGRRYADEQQLREALEEIVPEQIFHQYASDSLIVDQARKYHTRPEDPLLTWQGCSNGGACGCVLDNLAGTVYGFYPFWLADDKKPAEAEQDDEKPAEAEQDDEKPAEGEQRSRGENETDAKRAGDSVQFIDFSLISRIGFYAVTFDENGDIQQTGNWDVERANFVREARRYEIKLDLVVFKNDWKRWFENAGDRETDWLVTHIVDLMDLPLTDFRSKIRPYISFGGKPVPSLADGVTINFGVTNNFDEVGKDDIVRFAEFVRKLKQGMLTSHGKKKLLNVMLMMPLENAVQVIKGIEEDPGKIEVAMDNVVGRVENNLVDKVAPRKVSIKAADYYLVFLAEPTTDSKKKLRRLIEDSFKGNQRRKVLRRIIPVITPNGHDNQQLHDDLIWVRLF